MTTVIVVLLHSRIHLIVLGIIGEYLGRIYDAVNSCHGFVIDVSRRGHVGDLRYGVCRDRGDDDRSLRDLGAMDHMD